MENDIIIVTESIEIHPASNGFAVVRDGSVYGTYESAEYAQQVANSLADEEQAAAIAAATEEWPEDTIREYIESHDENDKTPDEQLLAMFRAVYGRSPDGREEWLDMWSHICAGVSHS